MLGLDINAQLNGTSHRSVMTAMSSHVQSKLKFALEYELCELRGESYPWPLNYLIPMRERKNKIKELLAQTPVLQPKEIYDSAGQVLKDLSVLLGNKKYLFGNSPTSLDALVFSYLHIIFSLLSMSTGQSQLRKLATAYTNLAQYSRRIWTEWYANVDSVGSSIENE